MTWDFTQDVQRLWHLGMQGSPELKRDIAMDEFLNSQQAQARRIAVQEDRIRHLYRFIEQLSFASRGQAARLRKDAVAVLRNDDRRVDEFNAGQIKRAEEHRIAQLEKRVAELEQKKAAQASRKGTPPAGRKTK